MGFGDGGGDSVGSRSYCLTFTSQPSRSVVTGLVKELRGARFHWIGVVCLTDVSPLTADIGSETPDLVKERGDSVGDAATD